MNSQQLERWKKAVVHLEGAADSQSIEQHLQRLQGLRREHEEGHISIEEMAQEQQRGSRDMRYHGTAVFLKHESRRYLLTARHVLHDQLEANRSLNEDVNRALSGSPDRQEYELRIAHERARSMIYRIVFRVPTLDEMLQRDSPGLGERLMNLGAGPSYMVPYTFSEPELDLAIISLDQRASISIFADELENTGYQPIGLSDIADEPSSEGAEVFTVGFPSSTAVLGQVEIHPAAAHWTSSYVSLPTFAFGRVAMLHSALNYFWCDMSIYPGNSGGPLVEEDKLAGIISQQAVVDAGRIPFGKVIKAEHIEPLLHTQISKDES